MLLGPGILLCNHYARLSFCKFWQAGADGFLTISGIFASARERSGCKDKK